MLCPKLLDPWAGMIRTAAFPGTSTASSSLAGASQLETSAAFSWGEPEEGRSHARPPGIRCSRLLQGAVPGALQGAVPATGTLSPWLRAAGPSHGSPKGSVGMVAPDDVLPPASWP